MDGKKTPKLIIQIPGKPVEVIKIEGFHLSLGRDEENDLILPYEYISSSHGRIELKEEEWFYSDLNSTLGTFLFDEPVQGVKLSEGDILKFGGVDGINSGLALQITITFEEDVLDSSLNNSTFLNTTRFDLNPEIQIGRDTEAEINLPAPSVSRQHAYISSVEDTRVLVDMHSTNGTFLNGIRVSESTALKNKDIIQIGPYQLLVEEQGLSLHEFTEGLRLEARSVTQEVGIGKNRKRILDNVDLAVLPGEFIGLVGSSGSGKTTFLNALSGFRQGMGQVLVNGESLYEFYDHYRTLIGYLPQDDIIHNDLTVNSALNYSAQLRLPPDTSSKEIEQRIEQVLSDVDLSGQRYQLIKSLSGGQRKRASISVELLANPRLFFLDEPTTGLDPGLEKKMMLSLREMANEGRTIVLVTHATANIDVCDLICFLSYGQMVYYGPPADIFTFFGLEDSTKNYSDIYDLLEDPNPDVGIQRAKEIAEQYRLSEFYQRYISDRQLQVPASLFRVGEDPQIPSLPSEDGIKKSSKPEISPPRVSSFRQFSILSRRYFELIRRDKVLLFELTFIMPLIGLLLLVISEPNWLIGNSLAEINHELTSDLSNALAEGKRTAFYSIVNNSQTLIFSIALAAVLLGIFASAYEIVKERSIFMRERMVTLRLFPYLASKVVVLGGFAVIQCLLFLLVINLKVDFPGQGILTSGFLEMLITMIWGAIAALFLGLFISTIAPNANTVIYIILGVLFFQIIFAGALFELPRSFGPLSSSLTLTRWTTEGLGSTIDIEELNELSRIKYDAEEFSEDVQIEVEQPDPENPTQTIIKTVEETIVIDPEPVELTNQREFSINYTPTSGHLGFVWLILSVFAIFFGIETIVILRLKDVR